MFVHRIIAREHRTNPWGFGNSSARWNPAGYPIIYTSSQVSLCATEIMAIMGTYVRMREWCRVIYKVDSKISFTPEDKLPRDWNYRPHPASTQELGKQWLLQQKTPMLAVPSARLPLSVYPSEFNLLLNPLHPMLRKKVFLEQIEDFEFAIND
ncbi:MAG: RES family NAD+ phosphorylase [Bacteroidetes bacterium]|nr:RES family NAD+ phosphorylase [Bacteroidota bacterium]